jgi:hypothetical protein
MPSTDTTIRIVHSEDLTFTATIYLNGAVVNLDGATFYFTAKWEYSDADADAVFQLTNGSGITITNPAAGSISVEIPSLATSSLPYSLLRLPYDLLIVTSEGTRGFPLRGTLIVSPNVTRT